jgi:ketosteroid isomerase-like protein
MRDPIAPPAARRPDEALELVSQAFSDGDLEAALAQYEDAAQLRPWLTGPVPGLRPAMAGLMALRLPLAVQVYDVLKVSGLTVLTCERRIRGTGPDCEPVRLRGYGFAAVRPQPDGTWRIAIDAWCLETEIPPVPPELPPSAGTQPG